jgi:hypothetical protein
MYLATKGKWKSVLPGKDCGIQPRKYIPDETKAMPTSTHDTAKRMVGECPNICWTIDDKQSVPRRISTGVTANQM